ncbi:hypothetical protein F183_A04440 [Bryobacterales bacterium F-183]|nr:hypothetical protein F183_A04440 [Bryobacterales bacterium F-183]
MLIRSISDDLLTLDGALGGASQEEQAFASALRAVLERPDRQINFHYQPIVDLQRGIVVGYEGLSRFITDAPYKWSPDLWFNGAERYGLRHRLEQIVTTSLLRTRPHLPPNCFLSVNVSPSFLLTQAWETILREAGALSRVVIEITENESVRDYDLLAHKLRDIRDRGGSIAVDDTGSGYSSLHHVIVTRPDFVKLDRIFVTDCDTDRAKSALIEMVGQAAGKLDAWIIAEGVETAPELDELIRLKVPLAQGYFLARPAPGMVQMGAEKTEMILSRVRTLTPAHAVETATEACPVCSTVEEATALLELEPHAHTIVVTDTFSRPVAIVERHPHLGVRTLPSLSRLQSSTDDAEALDRALTRPMALRFDPMVAINELGEYVGVVRMERLTKQVLQRV